MDINFLNYNSLLIHGSYVFIVVPAIAIVPSPALSQTRRPESLPFGDMKLSFVCPLTHFSKPLESLPCAR